MVRVGADEADESRLRLWWRACWLVDLLALFVNFLVGAALLLLFLWSGAANGPGDAPQPRRTFEDALPMIGSLLLYVLLVGWLVLAFGWIHARRRTGLVTQLVRDSVVLLGGLPWVAELFRGDLFPSLVSWSLAPIWAMALLCLPLIATTWWRTRDRVEPGGPVGTRSGHASAPLRWPDG